MLYKRNIIPQQRVFHLNGKIKGKRPGGSSSSFVQRVIYVFFIVLLLLFIIPLYVILEGEYGPSFTVWNPIDSVSSSSLSEKEGRRGDSSNSNLLPKTQDLPIWIQEYMTWHREMRNKYQGKAIIEDINAPPVLVRTCLGLCGGLHDRLGQLPLDLYLAYKTKRVLLLKWIKPQPLEEFLVPPDFGIDWRFPQGIPGWGTNCPSLNECAKQIRAQPSLAGNLGDDRHEVGKTFIQSMIDDNIHDLMVGKYKSTKAVTFAITGHLNEQDLEIKLKEMGETDMIHSTKTFGNIFHHFFQLNPKVDEILQNVSSQLGLIPGHYTIAHSRVRHPKAYPMGETFNGQFISNADKTGLPFVGRFKDLAVEIGSKAIACAAKLQGNNEDPIYFMADSSDLVTYLTRDLTNNTFVSSHGEWFTDETSANATAKALVSTHNVVARDQNVPNAHIDKNKGRPPEAYYATFIDLFLSIRAKCVSFGIGNYALFATKISGTRCKVRYAKEVWGEQETESKVEAPFCTL